MEILKDRVAVVTGSSRGIGRAIALKLASAGASVAVTYREREEEAASVAGEISEMGARAKVYRLDIRDHAALGPFFAGVETDLGPVDILVNNAAVSQEKDFLDITPDDVQAMMDTNHAGPFLCSQAVIPGMVSRGWGRIIMMSSLGGQWGGWRQVHYAASKAAIISLTMSLGRIYSRHNILTNAISPGLVYTETAAADINSEDGRRKLAAIPIERFATAEEIAEVALFLSSNKNTYITGQTINVNGGMYFG